MRQQIPLCHRATAGTSRKSRFRDRFYGHPLAVDTGRAVTPLAATHCHRDACSSSMPETGPVPPAMNPAPGALTDFSDRIPPVMVKELRQGLRSPMFIRPFIAMHLLLLGALVVGHGKQQVDASLVGTVLEQQRRLSRA